MTYQLDPECQLPPHLVQLFSRSVPAQLKRLSDLCAARSVEAARAQAHQLKGSLYAAGATRLAEDVETLRAALSTSAWPTVELRLQAIRRELVALLAQLERQAKVEGP